MPTSDAHDAIVHDGGVDHLRDCQYVTAGDAYRLLASLLSIDTPRTM
jgi:hypothetical protein